MAKDSYESSFGSKRQFLESMAAQLMTERASFDSHWEDLGRFVMPRKLRFQTTDTNDGSRQNEDIIDSTATLSLRTLRSGMMSGLTSPARPWFRLTVSDPELSELGPVKTWLSNVTDRMGTVFFRSNLYKTLSIAYGEMGLFGTACILMEEDFEKVMRFQSIPIGSYYLGSDHKLRIRVFYREFRLSVRQVVDKFVKERNNYDWDKVSQRVKDLWNDGKREAWVDICHYIIPNDDYDPTKSGSQFKAFQSIYYEKGSGGYRKKEFGYGSGSNIDKNKYLRISGYDYFPLLCYRWEVTGEDIYATDCPGMTALGDIKALQLMRKEELLAVEKIIDPPLVADPILRTSKITLLPGEVQYAQELNGRPALRPVHEVPPNILAIREIENDTRQIISRCFYEDLFLMLANSDRRQITAREIDERHEEKLLALGPVLENVNEQNDHLIDVAFQMMLRQRLIPDPPEELQGQELDVEYISIMAQAQKLISTSSIERFSSFALQVAKVDQQAIDKINTDQILDEYAEALSVPVGIIRSDDEVMAMRAQRQQMMQAQQMAQIIQQGASTAKDLSQASTEGENLLSNLTNNAAQGQGLPI